jgi:hypothetical protein
MSYYPIQYQSPYAGPIISHAPSISYSPISSSSFTQPSLSSSFSTFPSTATFASTAFTAPATPTSSFDAFGIPVAPVTPVTPAIPATSDTPDTPVNTDDKEHIFINIIVDKDSNNINNSTVVKKKEIDIKGELNKYADYTFYIIITDKYKKKFYLYAEDSYNQSTISKNAEEYDGILKGYKVQGDYCIIIYEKNCLIVWYNTEIDKNDIYKKIENEKLKEGQPNSKLNFISNIADKQNIMHNFLSNYVSTRFLENKFFKLIQNFSNSYIMNFIKELDTCNGRQASDRSLTPSAALGTSANFGSSGNGNGILSSIFGSKKHKPQMSREEIDKMTKELFDLDDDLHDKYYGSRKNKEPKYIMGQKDGKFGSNDIVYKNGYIDIEDLQRRINEKHPNFRINSAEKKYLLDSADGGAGYIPFWRDLEEDYYAKKRENPYSSFGETPMKLNTVDSKVSKLLDGEHWIDAGFDANGNKIVDF